MIEDKYIGLVLALSSSMAIGMSAIITKKVSNLAVVHLWVQNQYIVAQGLNASADPSYGGTAGGAASDNRSYLKNPIWWAGMSTCMSSDCIERCLY